jgi:hypothetical protein
MAVTAISDIINPEVLADQISAKFPDNLVLGNSRLVEVNSTIPLGAPGTKFKLPFWKRITGFGALTEGTAMTTNKVAAAAEYAVVQRAGAAYEVYDTAQLVSIPDPVAEIASQIGRRAAEYIDAALVTAAESTPNTFDQTGSLKTNSAMTMDQNTFVVAMTSTLGDNYMNLLNGGAIIMHSKVYGDLMQLGVIQNQYQFGGEVLKTGVIPTLLGLPIIVSDRVTKTTVSSVNYYQTYIVGPGALALFYQRQVQVEFDRDILLSADVIAATVHFSPHLFGWDDDGNAQAAEDAKSISVVNIKSK